MIHDYIVVTTCFFGNYSDIVSFPIFIKDFIMKKNIDNSKHDLAKHKEVRRRIEDEDFNMNNTPIIETEILDEIKNNHSLNTFGPFFPENEQELLYLYEKSENVNEKLKIILNFAVKYPSRSFDFFYTALDYDLNFFGLKLLDLGITDFLMSNIENPTFFPKICLIFAQLIEYDAATYVEQILESFSPYIFQNDYDILKHFPYESLIYFYSVVKNVHILKTNFLQKFQAILQISFEMNNAKIAKLAAWILYYLFDSFPLNFLNFFNNEILNHIFQILYNSESKIKLRIIILKIMTRMFDIKIDINPINQLFPILIKYLNEENPIIYPLQEMSLIVILHILSNSKFENSPDIFHFFSESFFVLFQIIEKNLIQGPMGIKQRALLTLSKMISLDFHYDEQIFSSSLFQFLFSDPDIFNDESLSNAFFKSYLKLCSRLISQGKSQLLIAFFSNEEFRNSIMEIQQSSHECQNIIDLLISLSENEDD